jgi:hypothetical protein
LKLAAHRRGRHVTDADRRDLREMKTGEQRYFHRVGSVPDIEQIEESATRNGAQKVAVLARMEMAQQDRVVGWTPDMALAALIRLRELARFLDELLASFLRHRAWLEQLSEVLGETFEDGEEEAEQTKQRSVLEHGPPPTVWLSAVQPHAPPGRFFSAPCGEMRLSQARKGPMAA